MSKGTNDTPAHPIFNVALVVQDIEASKKFYEGILEMQPIQTFNVSKSDSKQMNFANGKAFNIYRCQTVKGNSSTVLKLVEILEDVPKDEPLQTPGGTEPAPTPARPAQTGIDGYAGVNYLTFHYDDAKELAKVVKKMEAAGVEIIGQIANDIFGAAYVRDPNGLFIELIYDA